MAIENRKGELLEQLLSVCQETLAVSRDIRQYLQQNTPLTFVSDISDVTPNDN